MVAGMEYAMDAERAESAHQRALNANLLRISRERANADRKLRPKKKRAYRLFGCFFRRNRLSVQRRQSACKEGITLENGDTESVCGGFSRGADTEASPGGVASGR